MDIHPHWQAIRQVVELALKRNRYCAVATVDPDGSPRISPIGSIFFKDAGKAYYFEQFPVSMRQNLDREPRVCVLAVTGGFWAMMRALFRGRFATPPGLRLMGRAGARRLATEEEQKLWRERIKSFRGLKGYDLLWKDMRYVRDITFDAFEPLRLGRMAAGLWGEAGE